MEDKKVVKISSDLHKQVKVKAAMTGMGVSEIVEQAIKQFLSNDG